ncbi:hypothetical protein FRX31_021563 [Thalictrum thalictroides]|uniref:Uncharacterized protein n=1 Tax=Thalictrum thalictroides TaxID=46969 RepID=A0A7J6VW68_THATH|nr:hypothetical protein FRX31_021563 [Thalictrum thalictroides]
MASLSEDSYQELTIAFDGEEEDDDLFEINLELVKHIPPPRYREEGFSPAKTTVLLANCLLPIADVSRAIPANCWRDSTARNASRLVLMLAPRYIELWGSLPLKLKKSED